VSIDERLAGLSEQLTIVEDGDARTTGEEQHQQHVSNHSGAHISLLIIGEELNYSGNASDSLKSVMLNQSCYITEVLLNDNSSGRSVISLLA